MNNIFYSSKEEIRNRVMRNARDHWGIRNTGDLDPLVKLLIEALSTELFNISNEVHNLENRMVDKISGILASDTLIAALPAHAIMHAKPVEPMDMIGEKTQFVFGRRVEERTVDLYFSPLQPVKIFDAAVVAMASGNSLYQVDEQQHKVLLGKGIPGRLLEKNCVYVGIRVPAVESLQGLNFYFDWPDHKADRQMYDLLSFAKWEVNGTVVKVAQDAFYKPATHTLFDEHDIMHLLTRDVMAFYRNRFFTLLDDAMPALRAYPLSFGAVFESGLLEGFDTPLLWLKITAGVPLDELVVSVNAVPVVNKKYHDIKYRLKLMTDIIPLKFPAEEQFLRVVQLRDNVGNQYTEIPQRYEQERSAGLFAVRYGGTERFDERNAREILDYLFELLRDEKAAFASYGADFLNTALKDLEQQLSLIAQKTGGGIHELINYIVFKPLDHADIIFIDCWTTQAELGNHIRAGSELLPYEHTKTSAAFLLSSTQGGRSRLNAANRVRAYKYGLTTADRIVTQADIVNFCRYELGEQVADVQIERGLMHSQHPKEGFIKTVDVWITPSPANTLKPDEWAPLLELTRSKLSSRSTMNLHYRLLLK